MYGTRNMKNAEALFCLGSLEFSGRNPECERINIEWYGHWSRCTQNARVKIPG